MLNEEKIMRIDKTSQDREYWDSIAQQAGSDKTVEGFLEYFQRMSKTERALFNPHQVEMVMALLGHNAEARRERNPFYFFQPIQDKDETIYNALAERVKTLN